MIYLILGIAILAIIFFVLDSRRGGNENRLIRVGETEIQVEIADNLAEQIQGLSGSEQLCENCGMLFVYDEARPMDFWMKDMKFALDIIFIRDGKITEIHENILPPTASDPEVRHVFSAETADTALEVNAEFAKQKSLRIGDALEY
ncbi:MAG: DUF192 domain-containing protein [bacterium]|nr:DUF192 domain-containing protein [bacterium]